MRRQVGWLAGWLAAPADVTAVCPGHLTRQAELYVTKAAGKFESLTAHGLSTILPVQLPQLTHSTCLVTPALADSSPFYSICN